MTPSEREQALAATWARWQERFAKVREELEAAAARGDTKARRILAEVDGEQHPSVVNVPLPGPAAVPPPAPYHDREPGEDDE